MRRTIPMAITLLLVGLVGHAFCQGPGHVFRIPYGVVGLPETGQTVCYDTLGQEIDCETSPCPGQDGSYESGCALDGSVRFIDHGDGTVTDRCTGLMWMQNTADVDGDSMITPADVLEWCDALTYCENLVLAGHDDWRVPNVRELLSIVDYGLSDPAIAPVFGVEPVSYWTSTSSAGNPGLAWMVEFMYGIAWIGAPIVDPHVRAVRLGL